MRTWLLAIHIVGVAAWLGANLVQLLLSPRFARGPADAALAWTNQIIWLGERYYNVVGVGVLLTGVALVLDGDWSWGAGFVSVGITVVIVAALLGIFAFSPLAKRRAAALASGDTADADAAQRRIMQLAVLDTTLVLVAILAMTDRWQA